MEEDQEGTRMRVMKIGIKTWEEAKRDFIEAAEAARKRLSFKPRKGVYFTSLEAARNFLTPRRLELIHLIKEKRPGSIYELAKHAGRAFPGVLKDVELLSRHGLVTLTRDAQSRRRAVHPRVGYDAISLWIGV